MKSTEAKCEAVGDKYSKIADKLRMTDGFYDFVSSYILAKKLYRTDKIVEAGCGGGYLIDQIQRKENIGDGHLYAFDVSPKLIEMAKKINKSVVFSIQALPKTNFESNYFDIVILSETLEHLLKPKSSLLELRRIMKEDGRMFITIPNGDRMALNRYYKARNIFQPIDDYFYTFAEAQNLFRMSGLKIFNYVGWGGLIGTLESDSLPKRILINILNKTILNYHPDINRKRKRIIFELRKDDIFLSHDF